MDSHLIAVEVSIKSCADERVDLNGLAFNKDWLKGLDAETMQRWCTVQQHWVFLDDIFKHVPHLRATTLNHALGRLDVLCKFGIDKLLHDEGLEQFECHELRQTALMQLECRANHDDRTAGVVNALTKKVLTESALLALKHVGK
ncbi:unannotated protein [freshwater metagenome]|uniref:Unannotated protein n=1 Tax=freshwater metagenome TaxID=449393 RepID=A0A6J6XYG2_9ZZZZ